jgi:hypothetical protein
MSDWAALRELRILVTSTAAARPLALRLAEGPPTRAAIVARQGLRRSPLNTAARPLLTALSADPSEGTA